MDRWFEVCQKGLIQKHLNREAHKKANKLEQKRHLGAVGLKQKVVKDTQNRKRACKDGRKRPTDFKNLF